MLLVMAESFLNHAVLEIVQSFLFPRLLLHRGDQPAIQIRMAVLNFLGQPMKVRLGSGMADGNDQCRPDPKGRDEREC